jgi:hypothetical protein
MASAWYNVGKDAVMDGTIDLLTTTLKLMLVDTNETFNSDDATLDAISNNEVSGTGYTGGFGGAGRKTLASKVVNPDQANDRAEFDSTVDVTWSSISVGTVRAAILCWENTADTDSIPIAFLDLGDVVTNGGDLTIQWNAEGILQIG